MNNDIKLLAEAYKLVNEAMEKEQQSPEEVFNTIQDTFSDVTDQSANGLDWGYLDDDNPSLSNMYIMFPTIEFFYDKEIDPDKDVESQMEETRAYVRNVLNYFKWTDEDVDLDVYYSKDEQVLGDENVYGSRNEWIAVAIEINPVDMQLQYVSQFFSKIKLLDDALKNTL